MAIKITGLILAGGENSRIGLNKACLKLGGETFVERIAAVLRPFCEEIIVISNGGEEYPWLANCRVVHTISKAGPMAGIWTGLQAARTEFVLCAACDIPFIHPGIVAEIIAAITPEVQVVVPRYRGLLEPLCTAYAKSCLEPIERSLGQNSYKIQALFDRLKVKEIEESTLVKHDPQGYTFFNINCLEDYKKAEEIYNRINRNEAI